MAGRSDRSGSGGALKLPDETVTNTPRAVPSPLPSSPRETTPFDASVTQIKGIGERLAEALLKLGIATVGDLLTHYPRRYEDRSRFIPVSQLADGENALIAGKVTGVENRPTKNRLVITKVTLDDGAKGVATLTWFNQWRMKQTFERLLGKRIVAYGTVKRTFSAIEMVQPEWEAIDDGAEGADSLSMGRIVPIYGLTEGLGEKTLRKALFAAVAKYAGDAPETLPLELRRERNLMGAADALRNIHFPADFEAQEGARRRLVYDELLGMQLLLAGRKLTAQKQIGIAFADTEKPIAELLSALPFDMTGAQKRVVHEIAGDMASAHAMNRLVQGDVGSGKTAVAMAAMVVAVRNGYQAALMAPTEILAEQHYRNIQKTLESLEIRVELLSGSRPAKEKEAVRSRAASGETHLLVGTHALIQDSVRFARLGLAIIDEQHRFGVLQRAALTEKGAGASPDVLVMTATPIPRTLTLTVYGDLDVSIIDELPPGRKTIKTHWKRPDDKNSVYDGVRKLLAEGRQAYVVCSLVEESDKLQARAATELASHLTKHVFADYGVGLLHGQMPSEEKDDVMNRFRRHELDILVATTVIEVGVDVPNAAVMVIEDADRFGLAQLHQLRGRVGRGQHASFCILVADPKSQNGEERMQVMCDTTDGFKIAEEDLRLRGPGEFYGVRQSGIPGLKIADVLRDGDILREARADAFVVLARDPKLGLPENHGLREIVRAQKRAQEVVTATA